MTSLITIKKEVERLRQRVKPKSEDVITVYMWKPDGKDPPYNGGPIRIKALRRPDYDNSSSY